MVVRGDVLVKFGDGEWVWLLDGGDAQDAAQSAADPAYDSVGGRIRQPFLEVAIGNAGAVAIESAEGESRLGTFSEEGRERFGRRGKGCDPSPPAPAFPLAPTVGVHRSEERRLGKECVSRVNLGGRR